MMINLAQQAKRQSPTFLTLGSFTTADAQAHCVAHRLHPLPCLV